MPIKEWSQRLLDENAIDLLDTQYLTKPILLCEFSFYVKYKVSVDCPAWSILITSLCLFLVIMQGVVFPVPAVIVNSIVGW